MVRPKILLMSWKSTRLNLWLFCLTRLGLTRGVVENLLYVVANPQVHQDHGDDEEEEGEHLQEDLVQQDQEVGGQYDNDRWAWMQTEIQRINTKKQRQGA